MKQKLIVPCETLQDARTSGADVESLVMLLDEFDLIVTETPTDSAIAMDAAQVRRFWDSA